ncbi:MAG TPA: hypothetical protein VFF14_09780 [Candidatus Deferrimicrobium sp.]|nr:hypothetical protein [Candidatus Deferrimicrobium sp.]
MVLVLERVGLIIHVIPLAGNRLTERKVNSTPTTTTTTDALSKLCTTIEVEATKDLRHKRNTPSWHESTVLV